MKFLFLSLILFISHLQLSPVQEVQTIVGAYEGKSNQAYVFSIGRQGAMQFKYATNEVLASTNLENNELIGGLYQVSFTQVPSQGHDDYERTIVDLRMIQ